MEIVTWIYRNRGLVYAGLAVPLHQIQLKQIIVNENNETEGL